MLSRTKSLLKFATAIFVFALTCTLARGVARAATYEYYPGSVLRLGGTFNPEDFTVSYPPCIAFGREFAVHRLNRDRGGSQDSLPPGQAPNVAAQNELAIQQLRTRESLYSFLDVSVAASGHYGFFSASASVHAQNEDTFDSDSFVFGVRGVSTFGEIGLINPQLTEEAKALAKNTTAFHKRCGREWVSEETRGVLIAVVYNIKM